MNYKKGNNNNHLSSSNQPRMNNQQHYHIHQHQHQRHQQQQQQYYSTQEQSITHILNLKNIIESNNPQELQAYITSNSLSPSYLTSSLSQVIQLYSTTTPYALLPLIETLLSNGADVNASITSRRTPPILEKDRVTLLMFAILNHNIEMVKLILRYHPNINSTDSKNRNAIIYSVLYTTINDSVDILQLLIQAKANINAVFKVESGKYNEYETHSVFTLACKERLCNVVKVLIENYVNVNYRCAPNGDTGLHLVTKCECVELVKMLLACQLVNRDITNNQGLKAVDIAEEKGGEVKYVFDLFYGKRGKDVETDEKEDNNVLIVDSSGEFSDEDGNDKGNEGVVMVEQRNESGNDNNNIINEINKNNKFIRTKANYGRQYSAKLPHNTMSLLLNMNQNISPQQQQQQHQINKPTATTTTTNIIHSNINHPNNHLFPHHPPFSPSELSIPIELTIPPSTSSSSSISSLSSHFTYPSSPTLTLDLTSPSISLELHLTSLSTQLKTHLQTISTYDTHIKQLDKEISSLESILKSKEIDLSYCKALENETLQSISHQTQLKQSLLSKLSTSSTPSPPLKTLPKPTQLHHKFTPHQLTEQTIISALQKNLTDYTSFIKTKTKSKLPIVKTLINHIQTLLSSITSDYTVNIFGSYAYGLSLPWSNIDIMLVPTESGNKPLSKGNDIYLLNALNRLISDQHWLMSKTYITQLLTPVIHITTTNEFEHMKMSITVYNNETHYGIESVKLIKSFLTAYNVLEPIIIALKTIIKNANLNNQYKGGLSSYGLILMVVSFIQSQNESINVTTEENVVGKTFYYLLKHYGVNFDFNNYLIITYPIEDYALNENIDMEVMKYYENCHQLIIVDPLNKKNNVAKNTFQYVNLKMAFMIAFMVAKEDCECGCHYGCAVNEFDIHKVEHCILKRMFNSVKRLSDDDDKE